MKNLIGIALAALLVAPAMARAQAAEVICSDGTTSEGGRGACSGHGGIDRAATEKAAKAAKKKAADEAAAAKKAKAEEAKAAKKAAAEKKAEEAKAAKEAKKAKAEEAAAAKKAKAEEAKEKAGKKGVAAKEKAAEAEETVTCKDGTTSKGGRGACSGHGGIAKDEPAKEAHEKAAPKHEHEKAAPAREEKGAAAVAKPAAKDDEGKGPPTARCKDGSLSYSEHHTGACSRHGGVEEWLDGTKEEKK